MIKLKYLVVVVDKMQSVWFIQYNLYHQYVYVAVYTFGYSVINKIIFKIVQKFRSYEF